MKTSKEIELVSDVLSALRKKRLRPKYTKHLLAAYDERDVRDVLNALEQAGYVVVEKGSLYAIKKAIEAL